MTDRAKRASRAEREAAAWHARLGEPRVTTRMVEDFFAWRREPENDDAYRRVETVWRKAGDRASSAGLNAALAGALSRAGDRKAPRRGAWIVGGAALASLAAAIGIAVWTGRASDVYGTRVGEQQLVQLDDGSTVRLDTGSEIRVRFDQGRRRVSLERGQALFTVAPDRSRPFVVEAGEASVTAIGTVFDVRREAGGPVKVVLVSGVVEVQPDGGGTGQRLAAGQEARVSAQGARVRVVDAVSETSWTDGRIVFRDRPLGEAVSEVNRYLERGVVLDAPHLAAVPVNGVFRTGDRDAFVEVVSAVFGLTPSRAPDGRLHLRAENKTGSAPG